MSMSSDSDMERFKSLLKELESCSPYQSLRVIAEIKRLVGTVTQLPVDQGRTYGPGLMLPANQLLVFENIPNIAPGTTSVSVPLAIKQPGLIVGMTGGLRSATPESSKTFVDFQIKRDNTWALVGNTLVEDSFFPLAIFSAQTIWFPLLWPVSGTGSIQLRMRNDAAGPNPAIPYFSFAFFSLGADW